MNDSRRTSESSSVSTVDDKGNKLFGYLSRPNTVDGLAAIAGGGLGLGAGVSSNEEVTQTAGLFGTIYGTIRTIVTLGLYKRKQNQKRKKREERRNAAEMDGSFYTAPSDSTRDLDEV